MTLKERVKMLCKINGASMNKIEEELGFASGYLSKLGSSKPNGEYLKRIANRFNVTIDFLLGGTDMVVCPLCGFGYNPLSEQSQKEHESFHGRFLGIKEKYPFFMPHAEADKVRAENISKFRNPNLNNEERLSALDKCLEASYSLEIIKRGYDLEWLGFEEYRKSEIMTIEPDYVISNEFMDIILERNHVDKSKLDQNAKLLNRVKSNSQLLRILAYAEKLNPEILDSFEIQIKALVDNQNKG